jgi:hypothetical protein
MVWFVLFATKGSGIEDLNNAMFTGGALGK